LIGRIAHAEQIREVEAIAKEKSGG
jgi:hypothetical protein